MPELPEVETVRAGLSRLLVGREFAGISSDNPKSFAADQPAIDQFLIGSQVITVRRRAKVLLIDLSSHYSLVIHLKMTGQLVFVGRATRFGAGHPSDSLIGRLPDKSTRVIFDFKDGSRLFFNDQRKFGGIRLMPTAEVPNIDFMRRVGPEPLEADFGWRELHARLKRRPRTSIKAALLDQTVVAGIGNIYADESLWGARIHPATPVGKLDAGQIKALHVAMQAVLRLSIDKGGSTDRNYVDAEGRKGGYLDFAKVFRRQGLACPRCGSTIEKMRLAGRGTHFCPNCQRF